MNENPAREIEVYWDEVYPPTSFFVYEDDIQDIQQAIEDNRVIGFPELSSGDDVIINTNKIAYIKVLND